MTGEIKQAIIDGRQDFSENYVDIDHQWSTHNDCEVQSVYWTRPMDTANQATNERSEQEAEACRILLGAASP